MRFLIVSTAIIDRFSSIFVPKSKISYQVAALRIKETGALLAERILKEAITAADILEDPLVGIIKANSEFILNKIWLIRARKRNYF